MAKTAKTVTIKSNRANLLSNVTVAWYAFDDSKSAFVVAGKAALNGGVSSDDLLAHIRQVHIWKCLGNPADTFQPAPVLALLAKPSFKATKAADDVKRTAKEEAAYDAAKTQVSRARGALGLIAPGKANAPEANAKQIARRKADKVAADIKAGHEKAAPKFSDWASSDAFFLARADSMEVVIRENPSFTRGPVARAWLEAVKMAREHCKALDA